MENFISGTKRQQTDYQSFEPSLVNRQWLINDPKILSALSKADRNLGRLDMFSEYVPNLDLFVRLHITKEATQSSKIEDTKTEIEEALLPENEIESERRDDWREVNNYIEAMQFSIKALKDIPFSNRLLCQAHEILMQGVRGEGKTPGDYRRSQNWIGGSNPSNARFVPPHCDHVAELMGDLELFAHDQTDPLPPLIKIGIMHYQFETIHPFLDGNGRIGRLMIPLYLISIGILKKPVLYLSDFLESHREEYYDRLSRARSENDIQGWLHFFLDGMSETASKGVETFDKILQFQRHWEEEISNWKPQSNAGLALFKHLFTQPAVNALDVAKALEISNPTAYKLMDRFTDCGLIKEVTGAQRGKLYLFDSYLSLFR